MLKASTIWMAVATILLAAEFLGADFDGLLPGAVLALALTLLTSLVPLPTPVHGLLFAALAVVGVWALRRWSGRRDDPSDLEIGRDAIARVRKPFDPHGLGWVQWRRRLWQAQCMEGDSPPRAAKEVRVVGREGNRLLVTAISQKTSD
ncbi:MAG: NfeD family protein [Cyanobacteriota bacterium]|nr:NfeD family protein [Cyanobacteriota bacterium]